MTDFKIFLLSTECKEYGEAVIERTMVASLIIGESGHETVNSKCQHKSVSLIIGKNFNTFDTSGIRFSGICFFLNSTLILEYFPKY